MAEKQRKFDLWDSLSSVKLAVFLIIILAVTSIIGTIIPQNVSYEEYVAKFGGLTTLISALDLFDMYHSWWFVFLLALFSLNLIACSYKRLPAVLDQIQNPTRVLTEEMEKGFSLADSVRKKGNPETLKNAIRENLERKFGNAWEEARDGRTYLYFEKGRYSKLGVYITHFSILLILAGGVMGSVFGFRGFINIPEGTMNDVIVLPGAPNAAGQRPIYRMPFQIGLNKFSLSYYDNGMVKEYRSDVTVIENGKAVKKDYLVVNRPLTFGDLTFYQSNYGVTNRKAKVRVFVMTGSGAGKSFEMDLSEDAVAIPGTQDSVQVTNHFANLQNAGPAMILHLDENGHHEFPVFKNLPDTNTNTGSKYFFKYLDYSETYYTGLQATKDPGVWVVWSGCILMMAGLYISFFIVRKRLWVKVFHDADRTVITVVGHSPRSRVFEEEFSKALEEIKELKI